MRATRSPDGTWAFEDVTLTELRELMREVDGGAVSPASTVQMRKPRKRGRPSETKVVESLNSSQLQTWRYLVAHDTEAGVAASEYATAAQLDPKVAQVRLRKLVDLAMAHRIKRGRYRPGAGE